MQDINVVKKILVVGPNSFIAKIFLKELDPDCYLTLSVRDEKWKTFDYSNIDTIIYFAAIVHHPEIKDESLYNEINAIIPFKMAALAAKQGLRKFMFISTVAVFGIGPKFREINRISRQTPLNPISLYGKSKLKGEKLLSGIEGLTLQIIRLPNVYGKDCPGTFYHRIEQLASLKIIPIDNSNPKFSLISVENVAKALKRLMSVNQSGVFIPQDTPILSITDRIYKMAKANDIYQKRINVWPILWFANKILPKKYTDNLYGGFYVDPEQFASLTD